MSTLAILRHLPEHFVVDETRAGVLALHREHADALRALGFGLDTDGRTSAADFAGRQPLRILRDAERTFVLRHFTHGGLLRRLTGERFWNAERPFRELLLAERLAAAGIDTPQVAAARARRLPGHGWALDIVTLRVEGALDLAAALGSGADDAHARKQRGEILRATGAFVARLHDAGFLHADLHPKNLLVVRSNSSGATPTLAVLDLDRSTFQAQLSDAERCANLQRLFRYVWRRRSQDARLRSRTDVRRFLCGYDPQGRKWKVLWRTVARAHFRTLALHRLGWAFERALS